MAEIPGQTEQFTDERRLTTPIWYEWLLFVHRSVFGSWKPFTPTVTGSSGGTPTIVNASRYRRTGHTVNVVYDVTLTALNGATGYPVLTLPVAPVAIVLLAGRESAATGATIILTYVTGTLSLGVVTKYDNTSALVAGYRLTLSGTYEV